MAEIKLNMDSLKSQKEVIRHKIQQGINIFRILPPFGANADGYVYKKWSVVWGLIDPLTSKTRPFASSYSSEKKCPFYEYLKVVEPNIKKYMDSFHQELLSKNYSEQEIAKIKQDDKDYQKIVTLLSVLKPRTTFSYNVVDKSGKIGILELKSTAHDQLKSVFTKYIEDYKQDPTSTNNDQDDKGLWIKITRTGMFRETKYVVEKNQTMFEGQRVYVDDREPLPKGVVENIASQCYDLSTMQQVKTYQELKDILIANISPLLSQFSFLYVKDFFPAVTKQVEQKQEVVKTVNPEVAKKAEAMKEMLKQDTTEEVDEIDSIMDQYENLLK
jgi:hypothetical protein